MSEGQELVQVEQGRVIQTATARTPVRFGFTPRTVDEAWRLAQMIANSALAPKDYAGKPENCIVAMQMGAEIGLAPMASIQNIAVINGRPSVWGDAALALVQGSGLLEWIDEKVTDSGAICRAKRKGWPEVIERSFTMADAKLAGLAGKQGPWTQYPKRMMQMRARSWVLRDGFADALRGLTVAEEAGDIELTHDGAGSFAVGGEAQRSEAAPDAKPRRKSDLRVVEATPAAEPKAAEAAAEPAPADPSPAPVETGRVVELDGGSKIIHPPKAEGPTPAPADEPQRTERPKGKPDFELVAEITKLTPKVDEKHGKGAAKRMMDELYSVSSAVSLSPEDARGFIQVLKNAIAA